MMRDGAPSDTRRERVAASNMARGNSVVKLIAGKTGKKLVTIWLKTKSSVTFGENIKEGGMASKLPEGQIE
jgi:hypothetical protein